MNPAKTKSPLDPTTTASRYNPPNFPLPPLKEIPIAKGLFKPTAGEVLRPPPLHPVSGAVPMSLPYPRPPSPPREEQIEYQPPIRKQQQQQLLGPSPLYKQHSWSPDIYRDEAWLRRKGNYMKKKCKSVTDEDLDELKGCIELGFGFDSPEMDQRLSDTFPALELYYAVNKNYHDHSVSKPFTDTSSSSMASDCDSLSPLGSPHNIFGPGDNPQTVKTRLKLWAQVVACSVRQSSSSS